MSQLTNLTDRLSHLRESKDSSIVAHGNTPPPQNGESKRKNESVKRLPERKFATDLFMVFVYVLLGVAITCQFALIVFLDVL